MRRGVTDLLRGALASAAGIVYLIPTWLRNQVQNMSYCSVVRASNNSRKEQRWITTTEMTTVYMYLVIFVPGMFGVTPCGPGLYGEHCDKHCNVNCRAHVDKQRYCDKDTGDCSLGCVPERWGSQCELHCSKNCVERVCVQQTGQCSKGCTENYRGHLCEEYIETRPQPLTTVPPRNDPPEETHSYQVLIAVAVAVSVVSAAAAFVVYVYKFRHRESGTSTTELHGADVVETLRLKLICAADSHDEKTKSFEPKFT
ncbi:uncharacterized protein LOC124278255 [Haliotis rubra]|uniref:uncharacterized protein LOC124278255 n=1 Tax=Haliotis rubra TaxID=36100 RepID=UPI001EE5AA6D|nr:uncharacterized protein LOC124278255 [Haliotis rubra]